MPRTARASLGNWCYHVINRGNARAEVAVLRYVERNALRARLVKRSEDWLWASLRPRLARGGCDLLAPPLLAPRNWKAAVNEPQTEAEVAAIRHSIQRGTPFGSETWTRRAARQLGLESSLRPRGRPPKEGKSRMSPFFRAIGVNPSMDAPRWRQFSLKTLFCAITVFAIILTVLVSAFRRKSQCLERLHIIGAQVGFDYQFTPDHRYRPNATPPGNDVLKLVIGKYYASNPTEIHVMGSGNASRGHFTDEDARLVGELQELRWLVLQDTKMTDRGLAHLVHLTKLERLDLEGSPVTAEGIRKFKLRLPYVKVYCDDDLER